MLQIKSLLSSKRNETMPANYFNRRIVFAFRKVLTAYPTPVFALNLQLVGVDQNLPHSNTGTVVQNLCLGT